MEAALHPDLYAFVHEEAGQAGEYVWRVKRLPHIDPEWPLIIGDALTNLRASLHHLAHQLVVRDGGTPDRNTVFPILLKSRVDDKGKPKPVNLKQVTDPAALAAIEAVQPYSVAKAHGGPAAYTALIVLNELVNLDKYSLQLVIAGALRTRGMYWESDPDGSPSVRLNMTPLKEGDPVAWFTFTGSQPDARFDPHLGIEIRLNSGPKSIAVPTRLNPPLPRWADSTPRSKPQSRCTSPRCSGLPPRHTGPLLPPRDRWSAGESHISLPCQSGRSGNVGSSSTQEALAGTDEWTSIDRPGMLIGPDRAR